MKDFFNNKEIVKIYLKIFFSRTTEPISTKLGTKYPLVKGIQVCSNEWPRPFPRGDNYEIVKNTLTKFKNLLLHNWANFNQTWVKGIQVSSNEEPINSLKINRVFSSSLNQRCDIIMCLLIWTIFSGERCGPWASCFFYFY